MWRPPKVHSKKMEWSLVDTKHQVIYGKIPKAASTNWLHTIINLSGKVGVNFHNHCKDENIIHDRKFLEGIQLPSIPVFEANCAGRLLCEFYTFLFVRHPFSRLLSAYRSKVNPGTSDLRFRENVRPKIVRITRPKSYQDVEYIRFDEFIKYIIYEWKNGRELNEHWRPMSELSFPCQIQYDFIGKYEQLNEDSQSVLREAYGLKNPAPIMAGNPNRSSSSDMTSTMKQFKNVQREDKESLKEIYKYDFMLFGYDMNEL